MFIFDMMFKRKKIYFNKQLFHTFYMQGTVLNDGLRIDKGKSRLGNRHSLPLVAANNVVMIPLTRICNMQSQQIQRDRKQISGCQRE